MGGEGEDHNKKRSTQKIMTEFNLLQKVAQKQVQPQQARRGQGQGRQPATGQSKRERELEQYVGALQAQCQQDVYQLMSLIQQLGGFNQKKLIPFFKDIKKRYGI